MASSPLRTASFVVATLAALGLGAYVWTAGPSGPPEDTSTDVERRDTQGMPGTVPVGLAGTEAPVDVPDIPDRIAPQAVDAPAPFAAILTATDATNGLPVKRFWVQAGGFGAFDAAAPRVQADPATGKAGVEVPVDGATFSFRAPLYASAELRVTSAGVHTAQLERVAVLMGEVRDPNSAPAAGARVTLEYFGDGDAANVDLTVPLPIDGPTLRKVGEDGTFAFPNLSAGVYRATVTVDGVKKVGDPVRVETGAWTEVRYWLEPGTELEVKVLSPDRQPEEAARILVRLPGTETILAARYTDADGRVRLGPFPAGSYEVHVMADGGLSDPQPLIIAPDDRPTRDLQVILQPSKGDDRPGQR